MRGNNILKAFGLLSIIFLLNAETLFEVKDASDNKVFDVSTDGIRILNQGDTLMVISSTDIRANLMSNSKGLSRSFSVTTTSSTKGSNNIMKLTGDSTRFWISDTGSGFGVSTNSAASKSKDTNLLKVSDNVTRMRDSLGGKYTDFSRYNTFIGLNAGKSTVPIYDLNGKHNVFIGNNSGYSNTDGANNVFIGNEAGYNSNENFNTFIGFNSGNANVGGLGNTFVGDNSGAANTWGCNNAIYGSGAGSKNSGSNNSVFGSSAGQGVYGSAYTKNCLFGYLAGSTLNTGSNNVMVGYRSGNSNSTGARNVFLGNEAGYSETTSDKLYIENSNSATPLIYGDFSTDALTVNGTLTTSGNTTVNGTYMRMLTSPGSGANPTNYFYQGAVGSTTKATAFSIYDALWVTDNAFFDANVTVGGTLDINGTSNEALKVDGLEALWMGQNTSLQNYFSWGYGASYNYFADRITIGSADYSGYMLYVAGSAYSTGSWSGSDLRFKKNITGIDNALTKVCGIRGVSYNWRKDEFPEKGFADGRHYGVIAQELEKVLPEAVSTDSEGYKAVAYNELVPVLVEAVKELKAENESLKKRLEAIETMLKK